MAIDIGEVGHGQIEDFRLLAENHIAASHGDLRQQLDHYDKAFILEVWMDPCRTTTEGVRRSFKDNATRFIVATLQTSTSTQAQPEPGSLYFFHS